MDHPQALPRLSRRLLLSSALATAAGYAIAMPSGQNTFADRMSSIQSRIGGRLGVCLVDTASGQRLQFQADERFAMCSTFKLLLAAQVLAQADAGKLDLERRLAYASTDLLPNSPVTSRRVAEGALSIRDLSAAIVEVSDNTAANLLLSVIGGPAGFTAFARSIGDTVTRLDRNEMELNTNLPNDPRDTTTAAAMVSAVSTLLTGGKLKTGSRDLLLNWMKSSPTGVRRTRAGLPPSWVAGDKTGTGVRGAVNDVLIAFPPARQALVAAVYMSESTLPTLDLEAAHREIGAAIVEFT